jgi:hypothetical protein
MMKTKTDLLNLVKMIQVTELPYDNTNQNIREAYDMWNEVSDDSFMKNPVSTMDELVSRCEFIQNLGMGILHREKACLEEYDRWKNGSPDSPWIDSESQDVAITLVQISQSGVSSEWTGEHTEFNEVGKNKVSRPRYNLRKR